MRVVAIAVFLLVVLSGKSPAQQAAPLPAPALAVDVVTLKDGTTMAGVIEVRVRPSGPVIAWIVSVVGS